MIEIPDLDESSPYQYVLDQSQVQRSQQPQQPQQPQQSHHIRHISDITGDYRRNTTDEPTDSAASEVKKYALYESSEGPMPDQEDENSEDPHIQDQHSRQFRQFQYPNEANGVGDSDLPAPPVPKAIASSIDNLSYVPGLDSLASLALSEESNDTNAQIIEYNTAQPLFMNQINMTGAPTSDTPRVHVVEQHGYGQETFKLQDPPLIHDKYSLQNTEHDKEEDKLGELGYIKKGDASNSNLSLSQQLASPMSQFPIHDYTKESPQLPPPLSTITNKRLTLSNGEEFSYMRKELATYSKTPAEYTLHIVFTQFVRHAERKLNLCLDYPLMEEPPVVEILAEGVDSQFDKIVASLGYIARRKPKPVIDSVMFWRKSKSEVASMAASEVEKILSTAKSNLSKAQHNDNIPASNPVINKNSNTGNKAKRSLSLMRTKSISKMTGHSRNQSTSSTMSNQTTLKSPNLTQMKSSESVPFKQRNLYDDQITQARETAIQADRKSLASIYILCRVLIEVVKQASPEVMGNDLGDKLEEIVFTQLKTTDPTSKNESLVRSSNWNLFAELLGYMSEKRFLSVSDRFIANLERIPPKIKHEDEPKLYLLIQGMSYLKLTNYPLETFEESAEFIQSLAKFFEKSNNESIIFAYCEVLSNLLLPLASILTAETNHPTWVEAIEKIYNKASFTWKNVNKPINSNIMLNKLKPNSSYNIVNFNNSWAYSIHLMTSALSVSRKELFSDTWFDIIEHNMFKLKPKVEISDKSTFIVCVARLVWVYVYRLNDTLNNTIKKLDNLFNLLFFNSSATSKKQQWLVADKNLINALVEFIRIIGFQHLNYALDNVLTKLLKLSFNGVSLENAYPEKIMLVVKSYLTILEDYEHGDKPCFPTDDVFNSLSVSQNHNASSTSKFVKSRDKRFKSNEIMLIAKNSTNAFSHEEICRNLAVLLKLLDGQYGSGIWSSDSSSSSTPLSSTSKSQATFSAFHFGIDFSYQPTKDLHMELFATLIEAIPWTLVPFNGEKSSACGLPFKNVVDILTRNAVHANPVVSKAALGSLKKLASRKNPNSLITIFAKFAFQFSDKPGPSYNSDYINSSESHKLLKVYVELLSCWLKQFNKIEEDEGNKKSSNPLAQDDELMNKDVLNDLYQINYKSEDLSNSNIVKAKRSDELEWKTIITVIEEIEGNGLFFLCSQDSQTRHYGISILKLVEQFDQAIYNMSDTVQKQNEPTGVTRNRLSKGHSRSSSKFAADVGTRLIHVLEDTDFLGLIKPFKNELSMPERSRLTKLKNKKNILVKLAESDYGIDSTLWFRLYPKLLDIFFERCPMPVAMCRSIVCVRMVQMYEFVFEFSESYKNYTSSLFGKSSANIPPEVLVNQWRLYLIFACCSLTSTNEQKISFPSQPTHGRKKSMQMFIQHQKITSAKSVFRMVLPFLRSQQPMVRDAVISGLTCININIFKTLLENLPESVNEWNINSKGRDEAEDRLRIEVIHILCNITNRFKSDVFIYSDEWMIANLVSIIKNVKSFLSVPLVQTDVEFQRLRRYFCGFLENVFIGLQDNSDLDKWLPFEARIGCFNFLKEWCGVGDSADVTEDRYNTMVKRVKQLKETTSTVAILEVEKKALQFASLSTMAILCSGPIKQKIEVVGKIAVMSFDISELMDWVRALICSDDEKINEMGEMALKNILQLNLNNDELYQKVLRQCYSRQSSSKVTVSFFTIFVDIIMKLKQFDGIPFDIICLSTVMIGHEEYDVRFSAIKLLVFLEEKFYNSSVVDSFSECVCSKSKLVYQKALFDISTHFASLHPESAYIRISHLTMFFDDVDDWSRRNTLTCLRPWISTIELKRTEDTQDIPDQNSKSKSLTNKLDIPSVMVLNNLIEITVKFSSTVSNEVEALWVALGSNLNNFDKIFEFIMNNCLEGKNPLMVKLSCQIVDYLTFCQPNPVSIVDKFMENLQPKAMVPSQPSTNYLTSVASPEFPYISNLWDIIPYNEKDAVFSSGQLSMVFLVDVFTIQNDRMIERLPLLLHVAFSLLDHYLNIVQESAGSLLIHLIHTLAPKEPKSAETIEALRQRDHFKYLWVYDDLNNDKKGARTPKNMDLLARNILEILTPVVPTLQDDWSRVSLHWATTCAVRHIACRSFQIFRSLLSFLDQGMLKDMLHRLSNTISDETLDIQGFAMQILMTLNAITAELNSEKLIDFPQLFWSSVACLSTVHEQEFVEVLSTMSKFVSKIDLDAPDTVSCLISTFPPKWEGKFEGLQQIVMVGLRSATAWEASMKFLDKLNHLKDSEIIGTGDSRLLMSVLANLPRFLHALDQKTISKDIEETANVMSKMADNCGKPALARILVSLSKNRFRSKKDFLVQTVSSINNIFFPEYEAQVLVLLLGFLSNRTPWIKLETMNLLKHIFPLVDLERDEFVGVGADLISPLLRLLLTDYAEPALEVLDEAVIISGSQLDKDVLRMSLGNSSMKKEYEKTATLFGIPEESGWAVPMPVVTAASTRNNVYAVFSTCTEATYVDENDEESNDDENIQFHMEDYYAPVVDHGDAASASVEEPDASLSNMWAALDDFDSFFTKDTDQNGPLPISTLAARRDSYNHHIHSASIDTKYSNSSDPTTFMDSAPQVYDNKASLILNRSLARTKSNTSFKNNLADSIGASEHVSPGASTMYKKSYIPFRHSKHPIKTKNESYITPKMPTSSTFDPEYTISPKSLSLSNSTLSPYEDEASSPIIKNMESTSPSINETPTRFENLIGGSKRKTKKTNRFSPNYNNATASPNAPHHYWGSNKHADASLVSNSSTPPSSTQTSQRLIQKSKDKKKRVA
ncbi:DEHA2A09218p [Debaryomyces hansenii CBS767]|uniref:DEHA2A09218p n=1 Tax=Debaryomyces hansenii (strain ATCC 36239 / CBS 767 / BCRC 21394 / JCM 1990 / NBRC 0083 / IGC 2968) TaxID=284592 RepID=Q6BYI9_DEBHA|nr:DEHA2A09218p [Debaryomyces hansenii CBS767]CAG84689.2 DEHA2A09218p [Debaryomyces hansenii CBS767]|eukprot:XP_456730.2 DEHA2A09218p [Debaryomyces hansenii CBS767]